MGNTQTHTVLVERFWIRKKRLKTHPFVKKQDPQNPTLNPKKSKNFQPKKKRKFKKGTK